VPRLDSLYRRGDIRFFKQCPEQSKSITSFLFSILHATSKSDLYSIIAKPGTPFRERISWFLLFQQSIMRIDTKEISLWSALTSSDTQAYINEESLTDVLYKLWCERMTEFYSIGN
jgi:hypothetical protein